MVQQGMAANRQTSSSMQPTPDAQDKKSLLPVKPYATEQSLMVSPNYLLFRRVYHAVVHWKPYWRHDCYTQFRRALIYVCKCKRVLDQDMCIEL